MDQAVAEFLAHSALFVHLPEDARADLSRDMDVVGLDPGRILFRKGDEGDAAYFVLEGSVHLESNGVVLLARGAGECVGEFALLDRAPRSATAIADVPSRLIRWSRVGFHRALEQYPQIASGFFHLLTGKLREDVTTQVDYLLEQQHWRLELQWAREVQLGLLPPENAALPWADLAAHCTPAGAVGGDFYDYLVLPSSGRGEALGVLIGDVTGHGFYSALLAAMGKSCFHTQARFDAGPSAVMQAMRRSVALSIGRRRLLMSCAYVLLDADGRLRYANAGHPPPLHRRAGSATIEPLDALDTILGVETGEEGAAEEGASAFRPGDVLVLYSDGLTETRNRDGEEFGRRRLEEVLARGPTDSVTGVRDAIIGAVTRHRGGREVDDDLTLVVVGAHAGGPAARGRRRP